MAKSIRQIQKAYQQQQPPPLPNRFLGKVGNRDGDWNAGNGYVYVRDVVSGITVEAKNLIGSASLNYAVWVEKRGQDYYIVDVWNYLPQGENELPAQVPDHDHAWPDPNFTPIWPAAIMPFNIWPTGSAFEVQIFGGVFMKSDGTFGKLANQTFDLASYQPAAGALIVHFQYDDDGTVSVVTGTSIDDPRALSVADIPAATQHSMRVGVKLYESQTAVRRDGQIDDFYDWRFGIPGLVDYALESLNTIAIDGVAVYSTIDPSASPPDDGMVLTYDAYIDAWVPSTAGAGDMLKSVYDTDDDGVVDDAENTQAIDGVPVDNYPPPSGEGPVDGDVLTYDEYYGAYVPATPASSAWDGNIEDIDETSSSEIGMALEDNDEFIVWVEDSLFLNWFRSKVSRIWTYIQSKLVGVSSDTEVIFNNAGSVDGAPGLAYDPAAFSGEGQVTVSNLDVQQTISYGLIAPNQITANQDDYAPTGIEMTIGLILSSDGDYNITGIDTGYMDRVLFVHNQGSNILTLTDQDASSSSENQFNFGFDLELGPLQSCWLYYQSSIVGWKLLATSAKMGNQIQLDTTNFDNNLSSADSDVQAALETLDELVTSGGGAVPHEPEGRLTLVSGSPVMTSEQAAKTSVYYSPYKGDLVPIYNSSWTETTFTELTQALDSNAAHTGYHQSGKNFDFFVYDDSGTLRLVTGPAWTNDTTRATALEYVNGILMNAASMTARFGTASGDTVTVAQDRGTYVGTMRASANGTTTWELGGAAAGGDEARLYLWNAYNRVKVGVSVRDSTASWAYNSTTVRSLNGSATNRVSMVRGLDEDDVNASISMPFSGGAAGDYIFGISLDSTSSVTQSMNYGSFGTYLGPASSGWAGKPGLGYHYLQVVEAQITTASSATGFGSITGIQMENLTASLMM